MIRLRAPEIIALCGWLVLGADAACVDDSAGRGSTAGGAGSAAAGGMGGTHQERDAASATDDSGGKAGASMSSASGGNATSVGSAGGHAGANGAGASGSAAGSGAGSGGSAASSAAAGSGGGAGTSGAGGESGIMNTGAFPAASSLKATEAETADKNFTILDTPNVKAGPFPEASFSDGAGAPTIAAAISLAPTSTDFHGSASFALQALGSDAAGEAGLTYVWESTGDTPNVAFSPNHSNAAKKTSVTVTSSGIFSFRVTIKNTAGKAITAGVVVRVLLSS